MRRRLLPLILLAAALVASGCGNKETETKFAATEGVWVDAGPLDYHVQGSRAFNPAQVPDDRYLAGVPDDVTAPNIEEEWFGVFLRIENKTDARAETAADFQIEDTDGNIFKPIAVDTKTNAFAYAPTILTPGTAVPHPDSTQDIDSAQGSLLLFKLPLTSIADRPLELKITAPDGDSARVTLDV